MLEARAQYDFSGRTERELSFKKGDMLVVYSQVSTDWWEGAALCEKADCRALRWELKINRIKKSEGAI